MKVSGTHLLNAPRDRVWQCLNDPAFLKECLPGCESMEATGPDQYQVTLTDRYCRGQREIYRQRDPVGERAAAALQDAGGGQGHGRLHAGDWAARAVRGSARDEGGVSGGCPSRRADRQRRSTAARGGGEDDGGPILHRCGYPARCLGFSTSITASWRDPGLLWPAATSLIAIPVQASSWRTLVQFLIDQCQVKLRRWFGVRIMLAKDLLRRGLCGPY